MVEFENTVDAFFDGDIAPVIDRIIDLEVFPKPTNASLPAMGSGK